MLKAGLLEKNTTGVAQRIGVHFVFNTTDNTLYFDQDGRDNKRATLVARFTKDTQISHSYIVVL